MARKEIRDQTGRQLSHREDGNGNKISPWHDIPLKSGEASSCPGLSSGELTGP